MIDVMKMKGVASKSLFSCTMWKLIVARISHHLLGVQNENFTLCYLLHALINTVQVEKCENKLILAHIRNVGSQIWGCCHSHQGSEC